MIEGKNFSLFMSFLIDCSIVHDYEFEKYIVIIQGGPLHQGLLIITWHFINGGLYMMNFFEIYVITNLNCPELQVHVMKMLSLRNRSSLIIKM